MTCSRASGPKTNIEYTIVGKESVDGKDGFWMEWTTTAGAMGEMVMKVLIVPGSTSAQKVIMQMAGRPPMEMPMQMGHAGAATRRRLPTSAISPKTLEPSPSPRPPGLFRASTTR